MIESGMIHDLTHFKKLYFQTAFEYVSEMKKSLAEITLESTPSQFETLHRAAHSLKSQSQLMQYTQIAECSEILEEIFGALNLNKQSLSSDLLNQLRDTVHLLQMSLEDLEKNQIDTTSLSEKMELLKKYVI